MRVALLVLVSLAAACSSEVGKKRTVSKDAGGPRRTLQPPPGRIRAVPPHGIHAEGVGPYTIGTRLSDIDAVRPGGANTELVRVPGVVNHQLDRAEGGTILIGVKRVGAEEVSFLTVLDRKIAHTEKGGA